jgi:hypothetical protein
VLLRSIGKQAITDPDRRLDLSLGYTPIVARTMIHMTSMPAYFEVYKNIIEHYPMD